MTGIWERVYESMDRFDHTVIGGEFLPSETNIFGKSHVTTVRIHVLFGVGSIGIIDSNEYRWPL